MKVIVENILHKYDISYERGFLPDKDPLTALPASHALWDETARLISARLITKQYRKHIDKMPLLDHKTLQTKAELERAMTLLTFMGSAYIFAPPKPVQHIPASIAVPWSAISKKLGRMPIISHSEGVLFNWQRINPKGPINTKNLKTLVEFTGGFDESWFFILTVEIEMFGATAVRAIVEAQQSILQNKKKDFEKCLLNFRKVLRKLTRCLKRMPDFCDPYIFYNRLRPYLASFENVIYQDVSTKAKSFSGGSAAQSSLIQTFDAALGIQHTHKSTGKFLKDMRKYMPPKHAAFIDYIADGPSLLTYAKKTKSHHSLIQDCIQELRAFRTEHLKIVAVYIIGQSKKIGPGDTGTGGTNPLVFLKKVRSAMD